jgi:hypothetical protein
MNVKKYIGMTRAMILIVAILSILTCMSVYSIQKNSSSVAYATDLPCLGSYIDVNGNVVNVCPPSSNNAPTDLFLNNTSITEN